MTARQHGAARAESSARQPSLCIVLKATEAGGFVSHHLPAIASLVSQTGLPLEIGRANGDCYLALPHHYCAARAHALADRLNALTDKNERSVLEAEVSNRPALA